MSEQEAFGVMAPQECWEMLRANEFGRLAFHLTGEVHLAPINYAVDGESVLLADCDLTKVEFSRTHWPFLRDRRIDAYSDLTRRFSD